MCEYCDPIPEKIVLIETPEVGVFIRGDKLRIADYTIGEVVSVEKINFCPMCGRSLTDAQS